MKVIAVCSMLLLECVVFGHDEHETTPPPDGKVRFSKFIVGIGYPYYKILMKMGKCPKYDYLLFHDQKIWTAVKLNRILDIYYKADDMNYHIGKVDIVLVVNNTDIQAYSETGVDVSEFRASVFLPNNSGMCLYNLKIYHCSSFKRHPPKNETDAWNNTSTSTESTSTSVTTESTSAGTTTTTESQTLTTPFYDDS